MGGTAVVLPIAGFTARFALKPVMEAFARARSTEHADARIALLEQRLALMEEQFDVLERSHQRLLAERDFQRELASGVHG